MFAISTIRNRLVKGSQTFSFPRGAAPALPDRHGGALRVEAARCASGCAACASVCPTGAIRLDPEKGIRLDLGQCLFCGECVHACPTGAITHTGDHRMAARTREDLLLGGPGQETIRLADALEKRLLRLFGRSLRLRVVSAGGNGAEEADINVLTTIGWDIGRFGIQFVAAPRHADGLIITGPVSRNMEIGLRKTWEAIPEPKIVIAVGSSAISGGPFQGHPQVCDGVESLIPVDLFIPGWPPHPLTILDGLLRLLDRL